MNRKDVRIFAFADEADVKLEGQIAAMKRNELQGLEIRGLDQGSVTALTVDEAKEIREKLEKEGLCVWSVGSPIGKIDIVKDDFEKHFELYLHTLDLAKALGATKLRMFSFYIPKDADPAEYRDEVLNRLKRMAKAAEGTGILLCHENEKGIYGDNAARCLDILENVPGIRGVFDPANFVQCGQETLSAWELLKEHIEYMHIKDAREDGFVVPAGCGTGHVSEIVKAYVAQGGTCFTIEPHLTEFSGLSALEREGEKSKIGSVYIYDSKNEAFDAACKAFGDVIERI